MLKPKMPSYTEREGERIPDQMPPVIDAHVHIFPGNIFSAVHKWFDQNAWHIRYQMRSSQIFDFLLNRGVRHVIALQYAHKPGIADQLNRYMTEKCKAFEGRVTGMATVFPGEEGAEDLLQEAFDAGLGGLKLHAHVQCFDMNSDEMHRLYECCRKNNKPIVMHVGREPRSEAYNCDPYRICGAEKLKPILSAYPDLKICVPHLGFDEVGIYRQMIEAYDNLWLDTTMAITDYFSMEEDIVLDRYRPDRIMYGSDFPNIPYAWDRELKVLQAANIPFATLRKISSENAAAFFNLGIQSV